MVDLTLKVGQVRSFPSANGYWCLIKDSKGLEQLSCTFRGKEPRPGETYLFKGEWSEHPKYGRQFKADSYSLLEPQDIGGIRSYLQDNLPHFGPKLAREAVDKFGKAIWSVIEDSPEQLTTLSGISKTRALDIQSKFKDIKADHHFGLFCATYGIRPRTAARILHDMLIEFGSVYQVMAAISASPYLLAEVVDGIGFKKADQIGRSLGLSLSHPKRIQAAIIYVLKAAASEEGHCHVPFDEYVSRVRVLLGIDDAAVLQQIPKAEENHKIVISAGRVYLTRFWEFERQIAGRVRALIGSQFLDMGNTLTNAEWGSLDEDQKKAVSLAIKENVLVITGGPGVGKTYTVDKVLLALEHSQHGVKLAAPTGKAAKRMSEATGRVATTIHRLLEWSPMINGFKRNAENPIDAPAIIIDEVSMVDIELMHHLMQAVAPTTKLIFVGDRDQLPSVGPGSVINDLIESGKVPVAHLRTLHRQAAKSLINVNAQRINAGQKLDLAPIEDAQPDLWFFANDHPFHIQQLIIQSVQRAKEFFKHDLSNIQVLCPQKKGIIGVYELNIALRDQVFNPSGTEIKGTDFRVGDRVLQIKNNYELGVFNGEIGHIKGVAKDEGREVLEVVFEMLDGPETLRYSQLEYGELVLAYAMTIHKSQGSEFPCVIMPIHTTNFIMLRRNLLYTGLTRAKQLAIIIGTEKALNIAIKTIDGRTRWTTLDKEIGSCT